MKLMNILFFLMFSAGFSQTVTVNDTSHSSEDLVDVLLNNACAEVSNVQVSSSQAVAYFNNQGGNFPISEGVIIRSGSADFSAGSYTGQNMSSQLNSNTDTFLEQLNAASGQPTNITDVAYLQFDFVPLSDDLQFDFLFASNEYGEWQCLSSDVFAFLLTDLSTGNTTNLALIPGTSDPVSVKNIKDNAYNPSCSSDNPALFSTFTVNNPAASTINMRGYTVVMNASSGIVPGNSYRIRLVIGDSNDANYDSAIFLAAGSFDTKLNIGPDRTICTGDVRTLNTGLDSTIYQHTWTRNGVQIPGATGNSLSVTQSGTYQVSITKNGSGCLITDEVVFSDLMVTSPQDISECHSENGNHSYDLTINDKTALGLPNHYALFYYASMADVTAQNAIPNADLATYASAGNQTIYIKLKNTNTGEFCDAVYDFRLRVNAPLAMNPPDPIEVCATPDPEVDLNAVIPDLLNGQNQNNFDFSFFQSQTNAENDTDPIANPAAFSVPTTASSVTVWVRVEDAQMPECYTVLSFQIIVNELPVIDQLSDVIACSSYQLPPTSHGTYYTGTNGSGQVLTAGDTIADSGTYYLFTGPDANGCTNQSSFEITLVDEYEIQTEHCGKYTLPAPPAGNFYTAPGGPSGTGTLLAAGTTLTSSQTIYYYVEIDGVLCRDDAFDITIFPLPLIDEPADVVTCGQYVLPALTNGNYYTQPNGNGTQLAAGETILSSQTLYVFNDDGRCTDQHQFQVTIIPDFEDVDACGSYTLPPVEVGGYYTQASGGGQSIPVGTVITASQTVYYYAQTTTTPNCTENTSFVVTIIPIPDVDELNDVLLCEEEAYVLPPLTNGDYFTAPDRGGTPLSAGDSITTSQTVYINNLVNGCDNETDFSVEIRPFPEIENFTDIYSCDPFVLPELEHGTFYTEPSGNGTQLAAGTVIDSTQLIYIYNDYDDFTTCYSENAFTVYVNGVEVGEFEDVAVCDEYILPDLATGDYFTESGGEGTQLYPGDTLVDSQEIFVYAINGERFPCIDEESFLVEIAATPELDPYADVENCGTYILPDLPQTENYEIGYYREAYGENEILPSEYTFETPGTYTIYVYTASTINPDCYDQAVFQLTVYPLPQLNLTGGTVCKNLQTGEVEPVVISTGLDSDEFTVDWYLNGQLVFSGPEYEAVEAGIYTVKTTKLTPEVGPDCNYAPATVEIFESAKPIAKAHVSQAFSEVAVITVEIIEGVGEYEYQLDDGPFQQSNEFYDVESGAHTITVQGVNGSCGIAILEVEVIKYPKFFTPNGDGHNETWNIFDLKNHPEALIRIFDRYGKLLTSFSPRSDGWNGTYNGRPMPSNDYWFAVEFEQNGVKKVFKSHFTLKRF